MRVVTVESATLATVGYDEGQELLQLEFGSRTVYLYFGVPAAVYEALLGAPSKAGISMGPSADVIPIVLGTNPVLQGAEVAARCDR